MHIDHQPIILSASLKSIDPDLWAVSSFADVREASFTNSGELADVMNTPGIPTNVR